MLIQSVMPSIHDIHHFYEANLPGYKRRDVAVCNRFFLGLMGKPCRKPQNEVLIFWDSFRWFVVRDWLGGDEIKTKPLPAEQQPPKKEYGKCDKKRCGGDMVKRQNRSEKNYFLGCSNWPKCNNTKPLLD